MPALCRQLTALCEVWHLKESPTSNHSSSTTPYYEEKILRISASSSSICPNFFPGSLTARSNATGNPLCLPLNMTKIIIILLPVYMPPLKLYAWSGKPILIPIVVYPLTISKRMVKTLYVRGSWMEWCVSIKVMRKRARAIHHTSWESWPRTCWLIREGGWVGGCAFSEWMDGVRLKSMVTDLLNRAGVVAAWAWATPTPWKDVMRR
jgi:hypothetical protein